MRWTERERESRTIRSVLYLALCTVLYKASLLLWGRCKDLL
jgi:hypothetical protein